jgi:hypothetical protein
MRLPDAPISELLAIETVTPPQFTATATHADGAQVPLACVDTLLLEAATKVEFGIVTTMTPPNVAPTPRHAAGAEFPAAVAEAVVLAAEKKVPGATTLPRAVMPMADAAPSRTVSTWIVALMAEKTSADAASVVGARHRARWRLVSARRRRRRQTRRIQAPP